MQFAVWVIIPKFDGPASFLTKNFLKFIILSQFVPRVIQVSLLYQKVTEISGFLIETAWAGATCNFLLYVPASHVSPTRITKNHILHEYVFIKMMIASKDD